MEGPLLIFSDSNALIGDIQYVFKNKLECVSSDSIDWVEGYLKFHDIRLLIADLDTKSAVQTEVLEGFRDNLDEQVAFLFLVSERRKLELERYPENLPGILVSAGWLIKPFSRDALINSVDRLCC
jgi:hypothetical protein